MKDDYVSRYKDNTITTIDGQDYKFYGHAGGNIVYISGDKLYCGVGDEMIDLEMSPEQLKQVNFGEYVPVPNTDIKLNPNDLLANDFLPIGYKDKQIPTKIYSGSDNAKVSQEKTSKESKEEPKDSSTNKRTSGGHRINPSEIKRPIDELSQRPHGGSSGKFGDEKEQAESQENGKTPITSFNQMHNTIYSKKYDSDLEENSENSKGKPSTDVAVPIQKAFMDAGLAVAEMAKYIKNPTGAPAGSWDFTVDSELQIAIKDKLNQAAEDFDDEVSQLYKAINDKLNECWSGNDYNEYKSGADNYKSALKDLGNSMRMFANHFDRLATGTDTLADELGNLIATCTTRETK